MGTLVQESLFSLPLILSWDLLRFSYRGSLTVAVQQTPSNIQLLPELINSNHRRKTTLPKELYKEILALVEVWTTLPVPMIQSRYKLFCSPQKLGGAKAQSPTPANWISRKLLDSTTYITFILKTRWNQVEQLMGAMLQGVVPDSYKLWINQLIKLARGSRSAPPRW